jgi:hypothetical protein
MLTQLEQIGLELLSRFVATHESIQWVGSIGRVASASPEEQGR